MSQDTNAPIVLVIDDEVNRRVLRMLLEQAGIRPAMAEDGAAGLMEARRQRPDLILLDFFMPDEDGFAVLRRFKADPDLSGIPIILLTILEREADRQKALALGASDFISKPFDMREVVDRVRRRLGNGETAP